MPCHANRCVRRTSSRGWRKVSIEFLDILRLEKGRRDTSRSRAVMRSAGLET